MGDGHPAREAEALLSDHPRVNLPNETESSRAVFRGKPHKSRMVHRWDLSKKGNPVVIALRKRGNAQSRRGIAMRGGNAPRSFSRGTLVARSRLQVSGQNVTVCSERRPR